MQPGGFEPRPQPPSPPTSSAATAWIIAAAVLAFLLMCGGSGAAAYYLRKKAPPGLSGAAAAVGAPARTKTFTSRDGLVSMVTPDDWKAIAGTDLSPAVDLGVCSASEDVLVFVVNEPGVDFEDGLTVGDYGELVKKAYKDTMKATFGVGIGVKLAGYPATKLPFNGSYGGIRLRGFFFLLKSPENFHHVVVATVPSDYPRLIGDGLRVVETATVVTPPAGLAPAHDAGR